MICSNCESTEFVCGGCGVNLQPEDEGCTGEGRGRGHTYTASEVKVLTETASNLAYALGRKDAGEEIAEALEALSAAVGEGDHSEFCADFADTARDIASQAPQAASDAPSGVPGHQEVSEAVRSPQEPCEDPDCPIVLMHTHPWLNGGN